MQEGITVEALLDSRVTRLVMNLKFARKQEFKLKKIERPIYMKNMDSLLNKEGSIEYIVKVNIYYQRHRKKTEINIIRGQKQRMILRILWLTCHNSGIDQRIGKVKIMRCPEKCEKQQRPKQEKLGW